MNSKLLQIGTSAILASVVVTSDAVPLLHGVFT